MIWDAARRASDAALRHFVAGIALLALAAYVAVYAFGLADRPIRSDAVSYYLYLPAWIIDGDPTFETESIACCQGADLPGARRWPANGRWIDPVPIGVAVLMLPFFAGADLLTRWSNMPRDGYSLYYQHFAGLAGVVYFLVGLAALRWYLRRHFSTGVTLATLVTITFGTNLFHYGTYDSTFSHAYSFCLIALLVMLTERWWATPTTFDTIAIGVVSGLIVLTRHPNAIFLAIVPLYDLTRVRARVGAFAAIAGLGVACLAPQLLIYKQTTGQWLVNAYVGGGFTFGSPHLVDVLFSVKKGLFFWSPALLLAVFGLFVSRGAVRRWVLPAGVVVALHTYVVASWHVWDYGGSYGHRAFTDGFALFAVFIASAFAWASTRRRAKAIVSAATAAAIALSLFQMTQYWIGVIPTGGPTWPEYRAHFLRLR